MDQKNTVPEFWEVAQSTFAIIATGVEQVFYQGINEDGQHKIGVVVYDLSECTATEVGLALVVFGSFYK
jgi:hypothetical protein